MAVFLLANGGFQRNRFPGNFQDLPHLVQGNFHFFGNLLRRRLTPEFLHQISGSTDEFVDGFNHVDRNTNGSCLICNGPGDGLPDPPGRISAELVSPAIFKFVHRLHQTDIPFLYQIQKLKPSVGIFLGNTDNEAQIGLDQLAFGPFCLGMPLINT